MNVFSQLYRGDNDIDFPKVWRFTTALSVILVVISVASFATRGLNLAIDFEGGSVWEVTSNDLTIDRAEEVVGEFGDTAAERVQEATTADGTRILRISGRVDNIDEATKIAGALAAAADLEPGAVDVTTVGPSWGEDITRTARNSLIVFMVLVAAYIAWRLEPKMAAAAMVSVVHDIVLTVGVYSVFQIEVTPATVISFLTILGFSLYDTIVVYDRVLENAHRLGRSGQYTYTGIMRRSLNQVLMRSVNTTVVTLLPVVSMLVVGQYVFGQSTLGDFSLALLIGLASGTYSSLFVAAPLTAWFKEREPRFTEIRARLANRGVDVSDTSWHGVDKPAAMASRTATARAATGAPPAASSTGTAAPGTFGGHPPRPRKKKR